MHLSHFLLTLSACLLTIVQIQGRLTGGVGGTMTEPFTPQSTITIGGGHGDGSFDRTIEKGGGSSQTGTENTPPAPEAPSSAPSQAPSSSPSSSPSAGPCDAGAVDLSVSCSAPQLDQNTSCNDLDPVREQCNNRPIELVFRYLGGGCSMSMNEQHQQLFGCSDYPSNDPALDRDDAPSRVHVKVIDLKDDGIVYGENQVSVGETIVVQSPHPSGQHMDTNLNVTVYEMDGTMLQTFFFRASCQETLKLSDRFGALQLVSFTNSQQGIVTGLREVNLTFTISNTGMDPFFTIDQLHTSIGNANDFDLTSDFEGVTISRSETTVKTVTVLFDLTQSGTSFTASTVLTAINEVDECNAYSEESDLLSVAN